jgi:hypothetical protein
VLLSRAGSGVTVSSGEPTYVALANSWIIINVGGGPVTAATAQPGRVGHTTRSCSVRLDDRVTERLRIRSGPRARLRERRPPTDA